jgi:hypothetical protein
MTSLNVLICKDAKERKDGVRFSWKNFLYTVYEIGEANNYCSNLICLFLPFITFKLTHVNNNEHKIENGSSYRLHHNFCCFHKLK